MTQRVRRTCRWSLSYGGKWYCKLPSVRNAEPPTELGNGCPEDCPDLNVVPWKHDLYGDDYDERDALPGPPKVVEWDDET